MSDQKPPSPAPAEAAPPAPPAGGAPADPAAAPPPAPPPEPPPEPTRMVKPQEREKRVRARRNVQAELIVKRKDIPAAPLSLNRPRTIIGRDRDACDVVLDDEEVSRQHASITKEQTGYFVLHDLGSTNGVTVGNRKVARRTLMDGDTFSIGGTSFTFKVLPAPPPAEKK